VWAWTGRPDWTWLDGGCRNDRRQGRLRDLLSKLLNCWLLWLCVELKKMDLSVAELTVYTEFYLENSFLGWLIIELLNFLCGRCLKYSIFGLFYLLCTVIINHTQEKQSAFGTIESTNCLICVNGNTKETKHFSLT
jgi:hypothetical protein